MFTVKYPRARLVKIDCVISIDTTKTGNLHNLCFYGLTHSFKMAESSINLNPWMYESKWFFLSFLLSFIRVYSQVIWRAFLTRVREIFPPFKRLKFGFHVQHFATFLFDISVWCFKIEFIPLPDLLNAGCTIIQIGLFYGGKHLKPK